MEGHCVEPLGIIGRTVWGDTLRPQKESERRAKHGRVSEERHEYLWSPRRKAVRSVGPQPPGL